MRQWDVETPTYCRQWADRWRWGCQRGHHFTPRNILICWRPSRLQSIGTAGSIRSVEISNEFIGSRTLYRPACSIVPRPTTLQRAPIAFALYLEAVTMAGGLNVLYRVVRWQPAYPSARSNKPSGFPLAFKLLSYSGYSTLKTEAICSSES
jgi:hypothetical protein